MCSELRQNPLRHLGQPQVAAGPHTPFCICAYPRAPFDGTLNSFRQANGPSGVPRSAEPAEPMRRCARPAPSHSPRPHSARARTPQRHTRSRAPQVELPPRALGGPYTPGRAIPLLRAPQKCGVYPWSSGPAPTAPLPAPPRRQRQVRVHNCQARPQPPPAGFPAPRDYRSCGGSVLAWRPRPGGGAGQVTRAALQPGRAAGEAPGSVAMTATSFGLATGGIWFPNPVSLH